MPLYEVELSDGRKLEIDADNEQAAAAGAQHWATANPPPDSGFISSLRAGAANVQKGIGKTLKYVGAGATGEKLEASGQSYEPPNYEPAADEVKRPRANQYTLQDIPGIGRFLPRWGARGVLRSIVEGSPGLATDLTAARVGGAAGGAVGGPVGALLGGGLGMGGSYFLRNFGTTAKETAERRTGDLEAEPSAGDKGLGAVTTAAEAALQTLPAAAILSRARIGAGLRGVAKSVGLTAGAGGAGAAAGGAQSAVHQLGTSASSPEGAKISDKEDIGVSALTGGAMGAAFRAPRSVLNEIPQAYRYRDMGGRAEPGAVALANRIVDSTARGADDLSREKINALISGRESGETASYRATKQAVDNTRTDLNAAVKAVGPVDPEVSRVFDRLRSSRPALTDKELALLDERLSGTPEGALVSQLAKEATAATSLLSKGIFNHGNRGAFSGGISSGLRKLAINHPYLTGSALLGGGAVGGFLGGPMGAAAPLALGVGYRALRFADKVTGNYFPARTFVDKFADQGRVYPTTTAAPRAVQAPAAAVPDSPSPQSTQPAPAPSPVPAPVPAPAVQAAVAKTARRVRTTQEMIDELNARRALIEARLALLSAKQPKQADASPAAPSVHKVQDVQAAVEPVQPAASAVQAAKSVRDLPTAEWAGMDPETAAKIIANNYVKAGNTFWRSEESFIGSTKRRVAEKTEMAKALSQSVPAFDQALLDATLQAVPSRAHAREYRALLKAEAPPEAHAAIDAVLSDRAITRVWREPGKGSQAVPQKAAAVAAARRAATSKKTDVSGKPAQTDDGLDIPDYLLRRR